MCQSGVDNQGFIESCQIDRHVPNPTNNRIDGVNEKSYVSFSRVGLWKSACPRSNLPFGPTSTRINLHENYSLCSHIELITEGVER